MLSAKQLLAVRLLAKGTPVGTTAAMVRCNRHTLKGWKKLNLEFMAELERCTRAAVDELLAENGELVNIAAGTIRMRLLNPSNRQRARLALRVLETAERLAHGPEPRMTA